MQEPSSNDASELKGKTGLRRLLNAYSYSISGLKAAFEEQGFRQLVYLNTVLVLLAVFLSFGVLTKAILIFASLITLIIELFNTAIEAAVDHTSMEVHPLAKRAKDTASAAQLLGLIGLAVLWITAAVRDLSWEWIQVWFN